MLQVRDSGQLRYQYQYPESIPLLEVWLPGLRASLETVQPRAGPLLLEKTAPRHYCWDASARTDPPPARAALSWCSDALSCPLLSYSPSRVTVPVGHQTWPRTWQTDFPTWPWTHLITMGLPGNRNAGLPPAALGGWRGRPWLAGPCPAGHASPFGSWPLGLQGTADPTAAWQTDLGLSAWLGLLSTATTEKLTVLVFWGTPNCISSCHWHQWLYNS